MKKNVVQEETTMSNAFWATCQTYWPRIMGIQLFSLGCCSPLCVRRCGTSHTTASEASGHLVVLNVPLIKYSHNGKRNNDFVNLSLQVLCLLNWLFTQQNCYLLGKNFAKLDYAQRNKKISTKKPRTWSTYSNTELKVCNVSKESQSEGWHNFLTYPS